MIRYFERLASHDLALRSLGRVRATFYERIVPLAPGQLHAYRAGDLLSRMVADVDALQNLYLHCLEPPIAALLAGAVSVGVATAVLPAAGLILAAGLLVAGSGPRDVESPSARAGRRQAGARAEPTAELIELTRVPRSWSRSGPSPPRWIASGPRTRRWWRWPACALAPAPATPWPWP